MLYIIMLTFMFFAPGIFYVFFGSAIQVAGENFYDSVMTGVFKLLSIVNPNRNKMLEATDIKPVKYRLKRKKLKLPKAVPDANGGNFTAPWKWPSFEKYEKLNEEYPRPQTKRWRMAKRLNMEYFTSSRYPFDYIVMGDRARIEEARKGMPLSKEEEKWIMLGYGFDGKPFGDPWGIAEECLEGYEYALKRGDLHVWMCDLDEYVDSLRKGYSPLDVTQVTNRHRVEQAERSLERLGNRQNKRLNKEILEAYESGSWQPAIKVQSGDSQPFQVIQ